MIGARNLEDQAFYREKLLPAAASTAYTDALDLVSESFTAENIEFVVGHEALPSLANDKDLTLSIEQSSDGVVFAPHPDVAAVVSTGAGGAGAGATASRFRLPSGTKRYIRAKAVVEADGGSNVTKKFYVKGKF